DGETLQRLIDGIVRIIGDRGDGAAVEVAQHHALEQVVDVLDAEGKVAGGVALDGAFTLEVADATGEQCHRPYLQVRVLRAGSAVVAGLDGALGWLGGDSGLEAPATQSQRREASEQGDGRRGHRPQPWLPQPRAALLQAEFRPRLRSRWLRDD